MDVKFILVISLTFGFKFDDEFVVKSILPWHLKFVSIIFLFYILTLIIN